MGNEDVLKSAAGRRLSLQVPSNRLLEGVGDSQLDVGSKRINRVKKKKNFGLVNFSRVGEW